MFSPKYLLSIVVALTVVQVAIAQNCYQELFTGSGYISNASNIMEPASCELRDSFPDDVESEFAVYTVSQYTISQYYGESFVPQVLQDLEQQAQSQTPYYIIFVWYQDGDNLFSRVEVRLELPKDGHFECTNDLKREALRAELEGLANSNVLEGQPYYYGEQSAVEGLREFVTEAISCCIPGARNNCSICLEEESFATMFGVIEHEEAIENASGFELAESSEETVSGGNYEIKVLEEYTGQWDGSNTESLSSYVANYFATEGKDAYWEAIILPSPFCSIEDQPAIVDFFESNPPSGENMPHHKALITVSEEGGVNVKVNSTSWLIHPLNFEKYVAVPFYITWAECPVIGGIEEDFGGLTPAGYRVSLPANTRVSFHPRNGQFPAGCIDGFESPGGKRYWAAWSPENNLFLGYKCKDRTSTDFCENSNTYFLPKKPNPQRFVVAVAEDCRIDVYSRPWSSIEDDPRLFWNQEGAGTGEVSHMIVPSLYSQFPQSLKQSVGMLPASRCIGEKDSCRIFYSSHPYYDDQTPLGRVVRANPCYIPNMVNYNFQVIENDSEYVEGLKNVTAVMLAFGFLPAAGPVVTSLFGEIMGSLTADKVKDGAVGFTLDLLLQALIRYYWPDGEEDVSWEQAYDLEELNYTQASASGFESILQSQIDNKWIGLAVSAGVSCLVDGTSSENQDNFDGQACAKGAFSAIMVGGFLESYPWVKDKLRNNVPKPKLVKGLIKFFKGLNPSEVLGEANPEGFGVYEFYKQIRGSELFNADDAAAFFEVGPAEAAVIANKLENNATLKTSLLNSNAWVSIRNSDLTPNLKLKLINDMEESADFAAYFAGQTAEMQEALTSAWKYADEAYPDKIWCTP